MDLNWAQHLGLLGTSIVLAFIYIRGSNGKLPGSSSINRFTSATAEISLAVVVALSVVIAVLDKHLVVSLAGALIVFILFIEGLNSLAKARKYYKRTHRHRRINEQPASESDGGALSRLWGHYQEWQENRKLQAMVLAEKARIIAEREMAKTEELQHDSTTHPDELLEREAVS